MQSISFGMRANHPKFGNVDNATAILEKKQVQEALQQTSQVLESYKSLPGLDPGSKTVISAYQKALPLDNKRLAAMGNGMTQALKKINHRMAQPGFVNQAAGRVLAMNQELEQNRLETQAVASRLQLTV